MRSLERLTDEILSLPNNQRALLAEKLVESLEFDIDPERQTVWTTEAQRRRDEVKNSSVETISGDPALASVRNLLE